MDTLGVQCDGGALGATTEEIDGASLADELHSGFPAGRFADGFNHHVKWDTSARGCDNIISIDLMAIDPQLRGCL